MPVLISDYSAPSWAKGTQIQTVIPAKLSHRPKVSYRCEHCDTPDGDFELFFWARPEPGDPRAPVLVLFHGLEGGPGRHYAVALMHEAAERGWRGVVPCYRTCGGEMNRLPRAYFAGDTVDCGWVLKTIHERFPDAPLYVAGMSLGANYIAKYLGDMGSEASFVTAAAAVGGPFDIVEGYRVMDHGVIRLYDEMFLSTLQEKVERKIARFGAFIDVGKFRRVRHMYEFDEVYTAPVHGFRSGLDYWRRCSAKPVLCDVRVPLLALNPLNDPFQPVSALPREQDVSSFVYLEQPEQGGHIGFPTGKWPGEITYLPRRILRFFDTGR